MTLGVIRPFERVGGWVRTRCIATASPVSGIFLGGQEIRTSTEELSEDVMIGDGEQEWSDVGDSRWLRGEAVPSAGVLSKGLSEGL